MAEDFLYRPSKWQQTFHNLTVDEALGAGSAGPGKTLCLLMEPFQQIAIENERCLREEVPWGHSRGFALHLRRTRPMLEHTIRASKRIFPAIDPDAHWSAEKSTWTFSSGYAYQFGHCKDPDSWEQYLSAEFTIIMFDELVQFTQEQYEQISGRLRTSDPVLSRMLKVRSMSNPVMKREAGDAFSQDDPHWVRRYFVEPWPEGRRVLKKVVTRATGEKEELTRIYLPARLHDNPDPEFVRNYERTLLGKPDHIRKALLEGDWWVTPGAYYTDVWNQRLHVCRPFHIPSDWPRFRSMDWGYKRPGTVLWWAMDPDGNLFCEKELTFQLKTDAEVAKRIREIEEHMGLWKGRRSLITGPADTQLWEERGDSGQSKADVMASMGVTWMQADKKSRYTNAQRLMKRLVDHRNGTTTPGIVFFETCKQCITTIPGIQTDPNDPECPMDGGEDHWHDAVLYACAFASHGRRGIPNLRRIDDDDESMAERARYRGRDGYGSRV